MDRPAEQEPGMTMKRVRRFRQVVNTLTKHGFGEAFTRARFWEFGVIEQRLFHRKRDLTPGLTLPQRVRLALEELGPTFIKLGQILSTRPDLIPPEIIIELKKLQQSVHFISVEVIKGIIESELGQPVDKIFEDFDPTPVAAASLAQVHRAIYKGNQVALKIQRPNIAKITGTDIEIMRSLANLAERYSPLMHQINSRGIVEEFAGQIKKELDFLNEAHNMLRFARYFAGDQMIHVPEVYLDLCTKHVVTMEYLDGVNISDIKRLREEGYNLRRIAKRGAILGFKSIFEFGFFHADPHPGNVIVLPGEVIGLVDYGMMASVSKRDRERLAKLVYFISTADEKQVARALNGLMESEDTVSAEELEPDMSAIIKEYADVPTRELRLAGMLFAMMHAVVRHGGTIRPQILWISKSMAVQEDIARSLDADFSLMELGKPYAQKALNHRLNPVYQVKNLENFLVDAVDLIKDLPYDAGIIMREIRKGRIKIEFEHIGLEPIRRTMERTSNRGSLSYIVVALLVSSSLIVLAKIPPLILGMSLFGFIGYIFAVILGFLLIVNIVFRGR